MSFSCAPNIIHGDINNHYENYYNVGILTMDPKSHEKLKLHYFQPSEWLPFAEICRRCTINAAVGEQQMLSLLPGELAQVNNLSKHTRA